MSEEAIDAATVEAASEMVEEHEEGHPNYVAIFVVLFIITAGEVGASFASSIPRELLVTTLLTLMAAKAALVVLFYMHLINEKVTYAIIFGIPIVFAVIFTLFLRQ